MKLVSSAVAHKFQLKVSTCNGGLRPCSLVCEPDNLKCLKSCRDQKHIAPDALGLNLTMVPGVDRFVDPCFVDYEYFIIGSLVRKASFISYPMKR